MKLETIYSELVEIINDDMNFIKATKLKEKLEQIIREETCYKSTSKTRVNAIKKVASKLDFRPTLTGYGIVDNYKVVTDSYHLIAIKEENMPLKLVTNDKELIDKLGKENCINGVYPVKESCIKFNKDDYNKISIDCNDIAQFYKLHKKNAKEELYEINGKFYNIIYLKNVIDVLGTDLIVYQHNGDNRPMFLENSNGELGLILGVRKY